MADKAGTMETTTETDRGGGVGRGWIGAPVAAGTGCRRGWLERVSGGMIRRRPLVSVVRLAGVIGLDSAWRASLTLSGLAPVLERAFAPRGQAAVALVINSPGGSAAQSSLIAGRIRDLATERKVPVLAFVEDVAASGGYWLACAADEIYADPTSILGSIGVVSSGFGFHELIGRYGVERRLYTAGTRKVLLDPFQPAADDDVARLRALQDELHACFIAMVRERRGDRLAKSDHDLFSGEFWTGQRSLALGLIDGLGSLRGVLRSRFGPKIRLRPVAPERGWFFRRTGLDASTANGLGRAAQALAEGLIQGVEERAWWARYGL